MTEPVEPDLRPDLEALAQSVDPNDRAGQYAAHVIQRAARDHSPMVTDGILATWLELWEGGMRPALVTDSVAQQHDMNEMARAALRLSGHLSGADLKLRPGLRVAVGDQLTVTADHRSGARDTIAKGTLLHVTNIDPDRHTVTVDIPTSGEQLDITAASPLARRVEHAYATARTIERELTSSGSAREPSRELSW